MYCVTVTFKMTEWVEQWICIKFCVILEHSSTETIQIIQKATAMGNWWLVASSGQCAHSCITSYAEFFGETSNHPGDLAPLSPKSGALWLLAFPKTKIAFERVEMSDHQWDSGISERQGSWWQLGELCEVPRCLPRRRLRYHCPMYNISCIFFNKSLYFSCNMAGYLLDRPHILCYQEILVLNIHIHKTHPKLVQIKI